MLITRRLLFNVHEKSLRIKTFSCGKVTLFHSLGRVEIGNLATGLKSRTLQRKWKSSSGKFNMSVQQAAEALSIFCQFTFTGPLRDRVQ